MVTDCDPKSGIADITARLRRAVRGSILVFDSSSRLEVLAKDSRRGECRSCILGCCRTYSGICSSPALHVCAQHVEIFCKESDAKDIETALSLFCAAFPERNASANIFAPPLVRGALSNDIAAETLAPECLSTLVEGFGALPSLLRQAAASKMLPALLERRALSPLDLWTELAKKRSFEQSSQSLSDALALMVTVFTCSMPDEALMPIVGEQAFWAFLNAGAFSLEDVLACKRAIFLVRASLDVASRNGIAFSARRWGIFFDCYDGLGDIAKHLVEQMWSRVHKLYQRQPEGESSVAACDILVRSSPPQVAAA